MQVSKRLGGTYQRRQMPLLGVKMALCQLSTCSDARQIPLLGVKMAPCQLSTWSDARANPDLGDYGRLFEGRHSPGARLGPHTAAAARAADREMLCGRNRHASFALLPYIPRRKRRLAHYFSPRTLLGVLTRDPPARHLTFVTDLSEKFLPLLDVLISFDP